jgi:pyruvate carboxylase
VVTLKVAIGDQVLAGAPVASIEAMKMEASIAAPISGKITRLGVSGPTPVEGGDLIAVIE